MHAIVCSMQESVVLLNEQVTNDFQWKYFYITVFTQFKIMLIFQTDRQAPVEWEFCDGRALTSQEQFCF